MTVWIHDRTRFADLNQVHVESQLGADQAITPEGYLVCRNVPIARTGWQDYLNDEICPEDARYIEQDGEEVENPLYAARSPDGVVRASRDEADVFHPNTIASFEGKDVTDDHPPDSVGPHNYKDHTVGTVINVRRGEDAMSDFLVADLIIKEQDAIAAVRAGKREVSCGYGAEYQVLGPGKVRQYDIIGNHVALVDRGRCGFRCAIGDKEPDMTTKTPAKKPSLMRRVLDAMANGDAKALKDAAEEMEKKEKGDDEAPDAPALEATGTHIHLHLGGEQEAAGKDPATAGSADEDDPEADPEASPDEPGGKNDDMHKRMMKLEAAMAEVLQGLRAIAKKVGMEGGGEDEDPDMEEGDSEGSEEAEGEVPEADEAEGEEEPKEKEPKDKMKGKDKGKGKDVKKDAAAVKDSAHLKDAYQAAVSGAEILSPGLTMPVFDSKLPAKATADSVCLLKRRALARAQKDEKNGGANAVKLVLGDKSLNGMACDALGLVFNGAVAIMKDRNTRDDKNLGRAKAANDKTAPPAINSISDFNNANRTLHKQPTR